MPSNLGKCTCPIELHVRSGTNGLRCHSNSQCLRGECSLRTRHCYHRVEDTRSIPALPETTSDFMLQGLDSLTHLLSQREPCGTPHPGSGGTSYWDTELQVSWSLGRIRLRRACTDLGGGRMAEASCADQPDYALSGIFTTSNRPSSLAACSPKMSCVHVLRQPKSPDVLCGPPPLSCRMQLSHACCSGGLR